MDPKLKPRRKVVAATFGAGVTGAGVGVMEVGPAIATLATEMLIRSGLALSPDALGAVETLVVFVVSGCISAAGAFAAGYAVREAA